MKSEIITGILSILRELEMEARQQGIEIGFQKCKDEAKKLSDEAMKELSISGMTPKEVILRIKTNKEAYEQGKTDMLKELRESKQIPEIMRSDIEQAVKAERERIVKLLENEHLGRDDILSKLKEAKP